MENRDIAIQLSGVKKMYKLGQIGGGTLTADLQSWWARVRGKEDPNTKIGTNQRLIGQTFMALNGIDLTVYKGEALGIIGSNGAGKSTMLKLLSQVTAPTAGTIRLNGRVASMLEVGTGFHGEMTGRENVYLNGAILGMSKAEIDAKMEDIIEFSEVRDFIDTPVKRYSSGMYVKLAFAVAAHLDSEIMIMDEVLAVGDMNFQQKCLDRMSEAAKSEGRTVLYVSHNMSTIRKLCTRCIVLDKGKIVFDGDVEKAISIYMNMSSFAPEVDIDLSSKRMKHLPYPVKAKMQRVVLRGKEIPTYQVNEPIKFDLTVSSEKEIENLCVRFEIKTTELSPVGSSVIHDFAKIAAGEERTFSFQMCANGLTSGKYLVLLVMYEVNEFGTYDDLDAVMPAFGFEVIDTMQAVKVNWNSYHLGRINFRDIELLQ